MKGVQLPINTVIIVALAILVMLIIAAYFTGVFIPHSQNEQFNARLQTLCNEWVTYYGCDEGASVVTDMQNLYKEFGKAKPTVDELKRICHCPLVSPIVPSGTETTTEEE